MTVHVTYENGVLRLAKPLPLPERFEFDFDLPPAVKARIAEQAGSGSHGLPTQLPKTTDPQGQLEIIKLLSARFEGDDPEVAAKHNEHQP